VWGALIEVAHRQSEHQREANPIDRFLALLRTAIAAGRAHVAARNGGIPDDPGTRGWCSTRPARNHWRAEMVAPRRESRLAGWSGPLPGHRLGLRRSRAAAAGVDGIAVGIQTLIKRLHESGRLKSIDEKREKLKIRRVIDGRRLEVLHLPAEVLEHSIVEKNRPNRPIDRCEE